MATTLTKSYQKIATINLTYGKIYTYAKYTSQTNTASKATTTYKIKSTYYANQNVSFSSATAKLDGTSKTYGYTTMSKGETIIQELTRTITHKDDGTSPTKSISTSWNATFGGSGSSSASIVAPKITRYPKVTAEYVADDTVFDDEYPLFASCYLNIVPSTDVMFYINFFDNEGNRVHQLTTTPGSYNLDYYDWYLTPLQIYSILTNTRNQSEYKVTIGVQAWKNGSAIANTANSLSDTFKYTKSPPDVSYTIKEKNQKVINLLQSSEDDTSYIIKGASKIDVDVSAQPKKQALIRTTVATNGLLKYTSVGLYNSHFTFVPIDKEFTIQATDTRGFSNDLIVDNDRTLINYKPVKQLSLNMRRSTPTSSNIEFELTTDFWKTIEKNQSVHYDNEATIQWKIDAEGEEWHTIPFMIEGELNPAITIDDELNTLTLDITLENILSYRDPATFLIKVEDILTSWENTVKIPKGIPVFEWGDDEVQVNGDLLLADINRENVINVRDALGGSGGTTDYTLLTNKPQINGNTLSGNMSTSDIGITIPTQTSQLTNNSGFITNSVSNLTNYTKTNDLATVATSGSYNDLSNKPTIPSKTSDLTNDSGFISGITSSDVTTALGYTPQEEIKAFDITIIGSAKSTLVSIHTCIKNGEDFRVYKTSQNGTYYYDIINTNENVYTNSFDYVDENNNIIHNEIYYTGSGNPSYTKTTIGIQEEITSSNKLDYSLLDNTPTIPTVPTTVSSFTNDAGYITQTTYELFNYTDLYNINSTSDTNFIKLKNCIDNNIPFQIEYSSGNRHDVMYCLQTSTRILIVYSREDMAYRLNMAISGTNVTTTVSTVDLQKEINANNKLDYSLIDNTPTIKESTYSSSQYNLGYYSDTSSIIADINNSMYLTPNEYGIEIKGDHTSNLPSDLVTSLGSSIRSAILKTYSTNKDYSSTMLGGVIQELFVPALTDKIWYRKVSGSSSPTFGSWNEMAKASDIPTKTSDLTNDSNFIDNSYHDSSKQDTLVSGTNIKTINGSTLLGSGNITIGGGGTATDVKINGTSITSGGEADILTNGTYSSNNKIATMSDIPSNVSTFTNDAGYITANDIPTPTVLYNEANGSNASITLSDNVSNYSYLEIFYGWTSYGTKSTRYDVALGGNINLDTSALNNNYIYWASSEWTPTTNKINLAKGEYWRLGTSGSGARTQQNRIFIHKVLGYK